jgi:polyphenol oxidase
MGLTSRRLEAAGFRHAFFTRQGGVSEPPFASLNFFAGGGDDPARVAENLARAARELSVAPEHVYFLSQVHGVAAQVIAGTEPREKVLHDQGDITLSQSPHVACGVRIADCAPVLLADRASGAVAAVHSGWRGTVEGAAVAGVTALRTLVGAQGDIVAAIGPHIGACCFEVGDDVAGIIAERSGLGETIIDRSRARPHVDLRRVIAHQLAGCGVDVDHVEGCTVCDATRFHSYRRDGKVSGRMLAAIVPAPR